MSPSGKVEPSTPRAEPSAHVSMEPEASRRPDENLNQSLVPPAGDSLTAEPGQRSPAQNRLLQFVLCGLLERGELEQAATTLDAISRRPRFEHMAGTPITLGESVIEGIAMLDYDNDNRGRLDAAGALARHSCRLVRPQLEALESTRTEDRNARNAALDRLIELLPAGEKSLWRESREHLAENLILIPAVDSDHLAFYVVGEIPRPSTDDRKATRLDGVRLRLCNPTDLALGVDVVIVSSHAPDTAGVYGHEIAHVHTDRCWGTNYPRSIEERLLSEVISRLSEPGFDPANLPAILPGYEKGFIAERNEFLDRPIDTFTENVGRLRRFYANDLFDFVSTRREFGGHLSDAIEHLKRNASIGGDAAEMCRLLREEQSFQRFNQRMDAMLGNAPTE